MKTKYYVKIADGLGNQMFEYAWVRALQKKYGGTIVLDHHAFKSNKLRSLSLQNFNLNENVIVKPSFIDRLLIYYLGFRKKIIDFLWKDCNFETFQRKVRHGVYEQVTNSFYDSHIQPLKKYNYIEGNWMSEMWFEKAAEEIKHDLKVKTPPSKTNTELIEEIQSCNSVCIHVRLGDFLQEPWNSMSRVCGNEYYNEAIRIICEKVESPVFYLFSNRPKDFDYIKKNYRFDVDVKYMDLGNSDYDDLRLMYSCKHQIMSNSTYSWWAQYLNDNPDKIIVAPCMHNKHNKWNLQSLFMDSWILVSPEYLNLEGMTATRDINSVSPRMSWDRVEEAAKKQNSK